eukprot:TRINITY_DN965_c0_g5_i1.p2 TRINITY_DN965_c0_g5~~TRINITY_DN965_c0_g5_i1.p2  ORF type:complete len:384 (-),score=157.77 TRINITY_DN965_c0_g5_i1:143-1231(-)
MAEESKNSLSGVYLHEGLGVAVIVGDKQGSSYHAQSSVFELTLTPQADGTVLSSIGTVGTIHGDGTIYWTDSAVWLRRWISGVYLHSTLNDTVVVKRTSPGHYHAHFSNTGIECTLTVNHDGTLACSSGTTGRFHPAGHIAYEDCTWNRRKIEGFYHHDGLNVSIHVHQIDHQHYHAHFTNGIQVVLTAQADGTLKSSVNTTARILEDGSLQFEDALWFRHNVTGRFYHTTCDCFITVTQVSQNKYHCAFDNGIQIHITQNRDGTVSSTVGTHAKWLGCGSLKWNDAFWLRPTVEGHYNHPALGLVTVEKISKDNYSATNAAFGTITLTLNDDGSLVNSTGATGRFRADHGIDWSDVVWSRA